MHDHPSTPITITNMSSTSRPSPAATAAGSIGLAVLGDTRTIMLTTYRRDGTPVGTPVHVVVGGPVAWARTFEPSGKMKRLRRNPDVEVAPCTTRGRITGPAVAARARILDGEEDAAASRRLAARWPVIHGRLIPWLHRRTGKITRHLELTPR